MPVNTFLRWMLVSSALAITALSCEDREQPLGYEIDFEQASYTELPPFQVRQIGLWDFDSGMALLTLPGKGEFSVTTADLPGGGNRDGSLYMVATFSKNPDFHYDSWKLGFILGSNQEIQVYLNDVGRIIFLDHYGLPLTSLPESREVFPAETTGQIILELAYCNADEHSVMVTAKDSSGTALRAVTYDINTDLSIGSFNASIFMEGAGTGYLALDQWHIWHHWAPPN